MTEALTQADQIAADLVTACGKLDALAAFVRMEGAQLRIIAPAEMHPQLARLFYRAADEMVAHCPLNTKR